MLELEDKDSGAVRKMRLGEAFIMVGKQEFNKTFSLRNVLFPRLYYVDILPYDRRKARNLGKIWDFIGMIIRERQAGLSQAESESDMLTEMLKVGEFTHEVIRDAVFTMFVAGFKTIQVSTTNLIYQLLTHPKIHDKLVAEIRPPLDALNGKIQEGFTVDMAMDLDYLHCCYWEAMRLEAPAVGSAPGCFSRDVTIGPEKMVFPAYLDWSLQIDVLNTDPTQWVEPHTFEPERFNLSSDSKWTKTPDGKPRNPLSFVPFFGGKRICLGKHFADVSTRFTIPILFHYMDLQLVDPNYVKPPYSVGSVEELSYPNVKFSIRKRVV